MQRKKRDTVVGSHFKQQGQDDHRQANGQHFPMWRRSLEIALKLGSHQFSVSAARSITV